MAKMEGKRQTLPIPNDWDGLSWRCVQIDWPASDQYIAILHGLLSYMMRGRVWDARTGRVKDAQAIGYEAWERNTPLRSCETAPECPECPQNGDNGESGIEWPVFDFGPICGQFEDEREQSEDDDMSNCPTPPIRIVNGVLQYWHCCTWVDIGDLSTVQVNAPDSTSQTAMDELIETEQFTDLACKKAYLMVELLFSVADTALTAKTIGMVASWFAEKAYIQSQHPDLGFHWNWMYLASIYAKATFGLEVGGMADYLDILPTADKYRLRCQWRALLSDDSLTLTQDEFDNCVGAIKTSVNIEAIPYLEWIMKGIGMSDFAWVSASAGYAEDYDCACPEMDTTPPGWSRVYDIIQEMTSTTCNGVNVHWTSVKGDSITIENTGTVNNETITCYLVPEDDFLIETPVLLFARPTAWQNVVEVRVRIGWTDADENPQTDLMKLTEATDGLYPGLYQIRTVGHHGTLDWIELEVNVWTDPGQTAHAVLDELFLAVSE